MNCFLSPSAQDFTAFVFGEGEELTLEWQPHGRSPAEMRHIRLSREDVSKTEPVQMCQALSRFFQEVDPVEDLLHRMLNGLKPPQIVVLGDDSSSFLSKVCNRFGLCQIAKFPFASNKILFNFCDIQIERTFCFDALLLRIPLWPWT